MAGEPQRWREEPCAGRDTRIETVVYENQLGTNLFPQMSLTDQTMLLCRNYLVVGRRIQTGSGSDRVQVAMYTAARRANPTQSLLTPVATAPGSVLLDPHCKNSGSTIA